MTMGLCTVVDVIIPFKAQLFQIYNHLPFENHSVMYKYYRFQSFPWMSMVSAGTAERQQSREAKRPSYAQSERIFVEEIERRRREEGFARKMLRGARVVVLEVWKGERRTGFNEAKQHAGEAIDQAAWATGKDEIAVKVARVLAAYENLDDIKAIADSIRTIATTDPALLSGGKGLDKLALFAKTPKRGKEYAKWLSDRAKENKLKRERAQISEEHSVEERTDQVSMLFR
jgi:hypothetical protein